MPVTKINVGSAEEIVQPAVGDKLTLGDLTVYSSPEGFHFREVAVVNKTYTLDGLTALRDKCQAELDRVQALLDLITAE